MIIQTIEIYKCSHCKKLYQIKRRAEYHEKICFKNPDNYRPCFSCNNLIKKSVKIYTGVDDYYSQEPINDERSFFYCKLKEKFLYTPQNEIKENFNHTDEYGDNFKNNPMPKECNIYEWDLCNFH